MPICPRKIKEEPRVGEGVGVNVFKPAPPLHSRLKIQSSPNVGEFPGPGTNTKTPSLIEREVSRYVAMKSISLQKLATAKTAAPAAVMATEEASDSQNPVAIHSEDSLDETSLEPKKQLPKAWRHVKLVEVDNCDFDPAVIMDDYYSRAKRSAARTSIAQQIKSEPLSAPWVASPTRRCRTNRKSLPQSSAKRLRVVLDTSSGEENTENDEIADNAKKVATPAFKLCVKKEQLLQSDSEDSIRLDDDPLPFCSSKEPKKRRRTSESKNVFKKKSVSASEVSALTARMEKLERECAQWKLKFRELEARISTNKFDVDSVQKNYDKLLHALNTLQRCTTQRFVDLAGKQDFPSVQLSDLARRVAEMERYRSEQGIGSENTSTTQQRSTAFEKGKQPSQRGCPPASGRDSPSNKAMRVRSWANFGEDDFGVAQRGRSNQWPVSRPAFERKPFGDPGKEGFGAGRFQNNASSSEQVCKSRFGVGNEPQHPKVFANTRAFQFAPRTSSATTFDDSFGYQSPVYD